LSELAIQLRDLCILVDYQGILMIVLFDQFLIVVEYLMVMKDSFFGKSTVNASLLYYFLNLLQVLVCHAFLLVIIVSGQPGVREGLERWRHREYRTVLQGLAD
jgi:hypothetical protein